MLKSVSLVWMFSMLTMIIHAQEFWMEPAKFVYSAGDSLHIQLKEGSNFIGGSWNQEHAEVSVRDQPPLTKVEIHQQNKATGIYKFVNEFLSFHHRLREPIFFLFRPLLFSKNLTLKVLMHI